MSGPPATEEEIQQVEAELADTKKQTIRPLGDRILVKPDEQATMAGRVILPENLVEKPRTGIVLAVGRGNVAPDTGERAAPDVQEGAHIIFSQYGGVDVKLGDTAYLILREGDVLGEIIEEIPF